ncbi:MAG TPA: L-lactate permease, partial [Mycobacteriales bacterium]
MYRQVIDPVSHSLGLTAIFAALPLVVLFVMIGALRIKAWIASLVALALSLLVAIVVYSMPVGQALLSGTLGVTNGFFPILWIVINAIWIYNITVQTGHFDVLRRSFSSVSDDKRIQAIIIAFCFGALLEALAGFGTPVAITAVMLIAIGFSPMRAAVLALVANTAPVAFGALASPITGLTASSGLDFDTLGAMVGRQTPILSIFVPLVLVGIVDGRRGVRQTWMPALVTGTTFGIAQYITSNFLSVSLADVVASLVSAAILVVLLRSWQPSEVLAAETGPAVVAGGAADTPTPEFTRRVEHPDSGGEIAKAYAPYLIIIAIFVIAQLGPIKEQLNKTVETFNWPGLHIETTTGAVSSISVFKFNWLNTPGSLLLIAGLVTMVALRVSVADGLRAYGRTLQQLFWAIVTVMAVLGVAFVMNASGQTITLGNWLAGAGRWFAVLSPIMGWIGVAVSGSDTSSNALFGGLQVAAAHKAGLDQVLMAAANSSGGVLGKMVSPQNLAIAASAVGLAGKEGDLFRKVFLWSLVFLAGMCLLVLLQSTALLSWMIP